MNNIFLPYLNEINESLSSLLPENISNEWQTETFGLLPDSISKIYLKNLTEPCRTLFASGGKRWRPILMLLCYEYAKNSGCNPLINKKDAVLLTALVEFTHTASLIHDDIEDQADTRRGKPASHITYGLDTALNAASWLYFHASTCLNKISASPEQKEKFYSLYTNELRRLHLGQAMDIYWHRNPDIFPTEEEYKAMVQNKTGTLSSLAVQLGLLAGGADNETIKKGAKIAALLGEGFQILDDVQNLTTGNPGKKRGDDIVEGKKSLPVLIHIKNNKEDKTKIADFFRSASKEGINSSAVENCINLLEKADSIKKAYNEGIKTLSENIQNMKNLFSNKETKESCLIETLFSDMIPKTANGETF